VLFEGPEKKLELLLAPGEPSLRARGPAFWDEVVAHARATVLSRLPGEDCDALLLSESSLFLHDDRMVMITCGRTTLIDAALFLIDEIGDEGLLSLIYERKNENFPEQQLTTFAQDVARLRERVGGTATIFGDPTGDHVQLFHLDREFAADPGDVTLEVLMYDIAPEVGALFTPGATAREDLHRLVGLGDLLPRGQVDDHVFAPQGYSLNGVAGPLYVTLHVTPQRQGSYVSFETNLPLAPGAVCDTAAHLLRSFRPARSDLLLFQAPLELAGLPAGYEPIATGSRRLGCGYDVAYAHVEAGHRKDTP